MKTTAYQLLETVWKNGMKDSWGRINNRGSTALPMKGHYE